MNTINTDKTNKMTDPQTQPYEVVRFNALKHGILSRYTVLSHENHADYVSLVNSLMDEHLPAGATEQHLIEELASVIWRKRRVLQAEGATINKGLKESARSAKTVIPAAAPFEMGLSGENTDIRDLMDLKPEDVVGSHQSAKHDIDATNKASAILRKGGDRAYEKALRALTPDTREWWQNYVDDEEYTADATGLAAFITEHVTPFGRSGRTLHTPRTPRDSVVVPGHCGTSHWPLIKATEPRKWKAVMLGALPPARSAIQQAARTACPRWWRQQTHIERRRVVMPCSLRGS